MSNKHVHFAEFLLNALDVNFENIQFEDDLIDITVDENFSILMTVSEDFKTVLNLNIFPTKKPAVYKLKRMSISALVRNANKIRSQLTPKVEIFDLSNSVKLTD